MAAINSVDDFAFCLRKLRDGTLIDFLRHGQFPAWVELASRELISRELRSLSADLAGAHHAARQMFRASQVETLARRLLLSRNAELLDSLRPLWSAFGTSDEVCGVAVEAVTRVIGNWPTDDVARFSAAHADFIASLYTVAGADRGILGSAIRSSRICAERRHIGFPVVVGRRVESNLAASVWIEPAPSSQAGEPMPEVWRDVWQTVLRAVGEGGVSERCPALPTWFEKFRDFAGKDGDAIGRLDSAGLSLAMQLLADRQQRPLPFGIGFTGRWDEHGTLQGVTDLSLKLQAAAEAGIFLFFACRDSDNDQPEPQPVPGVRLALLQKGLSLADVVRQVNRVCAESGLTEYRWRRESRRRPAAPRSPIGSRDLPEATRERACPAGAVKREKPLADLESWRDDSLNIGSRGICAVVGAARAGKTTLLSMWANDLPHYPSWFSFHRDDPQGKDRLMEALAAQIEERFTIVRPPSMHRAKAADFDDSDALKRIYIAANATHAAIDVVVDGLDEAAPDEQLSILRYLRGIAKECLVVVGTQQIADLEHTQTQISLANEDESALALLDRWAERFAQSGRADIARDLMDSGWRASMLTAAGGDLAVLNDSLRTHEGAWPETPDGLRLAKGDDYYRALLKDIEDCYPDQSDLLKRFIGTCALLDDRPWRVNDIARLVDAKEDEVGMLFAGGGPPCVRRWLRCTPGPNQEQCCLFASPNLRRFACDEFNGALYRDFIARLVTLLCESDQTAPLEKFSDRLLDLDVTNEECVVADLLDFAARRLPQLIAGLTSGRTELIEKLSRSTWLYRRLAAAMDDFTCDLHGCLFDAVLRPPDTLPPHGRRNAKMVIERLARRRGAIGGVAELIAGHSDRETQLHFPIRATRLAEVIQELRLLDSIAPRVELVEAMNFLATWGDLLNDGLDAWWEAAHGALGNFTAVRQASPSSPDFLLLAPEPDGYRAAWPTNPGVLGSACELPEISRLILASSEGLAVMKTHRAAHVPDRFIRLDKPIKALTAVSAAEVAVLLENELRIIDVDTLKQRCLMAVGTDDRFDSLHYLAGEQPLLMVVASTKGKGRNARPELRFCSIGERSIDRGAWIFLHTRSIEVVPFAAKVIARTHTEGDSSRSLWFYRSVEDDDSSADESFGERIANVRGACAIPGDRLAVTFSDQHGSALGVYGPAGKCLLRIPLYSMPTEATDRDDSHDGIVASFLLSCRPVAWHKSLGVLLASDSPNYCGELWQILPKHEEMPRPVPKQLHTAIAHGAFPVDWRKFVSLKDGTVLILTPKCAMLAGPDPDQVVPLFGRQDPANVFHEILGVRADASVIIRAAARPDKEKRRYEAPPRAEYPPGCVSQLPVAEGLQTITADGHELAIASGGASLICVGRNGNVVFQKHLKHGRIADVRADGDGGFVVAAANSGSLRLHRFSSDGRLLEASASIPFRGEPRITAASRGLIFVDDAINGAGSYGSCCVDLVGRRHRRIGTRSVVKIIPLPNKRALVLSKNAHYAKARAYLHSPRPEGLLSPINELELSPDTILYHDAEQCDDYQLSVASIIYRNTANHQDRKLVLERHRLRLNRLQHNEDSSIWPIAGPEQTKIDNDLACWLHISGHIALAFESGRIEIRRLADPERTAAVGYVIGKPDALAISKCGNQHFLAVAAGEMTWFDITGFMPSSSA
ncbi:MAG TPA: GTPase domain-containing protein [Pirellulales bacterium]|nr:GTPase domain-containing protein [Pirellulales bacterium]